MALNIDELDRPQTEEEKRKRRSRTAAIPAEPPKDRSRFAERWEKPQESSRFAERWGKGNGVTTSSSPFRGKTQEQIRSYGRTEKPVEPWRESLRSWRDRIAGRDGRAAPNVDRYIVDSFLRDPSSQWHSMTDQSKIHTLGQIYDSRKPAAPGAGGYDRNKDRNEWIYAHLNAIDPKWSESNVSNTEQAKPYAEYVKEAGGDPRQVTGMSDLTKSKSWRKLSPSQKRTALSSLYDQLKIDKPGDVAAREKFVREGLIASEGENPWYGKDALGDYIDTVHGASYDLLKGNIRTVRTAGDTAESVLKRAYGYGLEKAGLGDNELAQRAAGIAAKVGSAPVKAYSQLSKPFEYLKAEDVLARRAQANKENISQTSQTELGKRIVKRTEEGGVAWRDEAGNLQSPVEWENLGARRAILETAQSLPGTVEGMVLGGGATALAKGGAKTFGGKALQYVGRGLAGGAGEGIVGGTQASEQAYYAVMSADPEQISKAPEFKKAYESTNPSLPEHERFNQAREELAKVEAAKAGGLVTATTAIMGSPYWSRFGGEAAEKVAGEVAKKTLGQTIGTGAKEYGKDVLFESLQEMGQTAAENYAAHGYTQKYIDPAKKYASADLIEDMINVIPSTILMASGGRATTSIAGTAVEQWQARQAKAFALNGPKGAQKADASLAKLKTDIDKGVIRDDQLARSIVAVSGFKGEHGTRLAREATDIALNQIDKKAQEGPVLKSQGGFLDDAEVQILDTKMQEAAKANPKDAKLQEQAQRIEALSLQSKVNELNRRASKRTLSESESNKLNKNIARLQELGAMPTQEVSGDQEGQGRLDGGVEGREELGRSVQESGLSGEAAASGGVLQTQGPETLTESEQREVDNYAQNKASEAYQNVLAQTKDEAAAQDAFHAEFMRQRDPNSGANPMFAVMAENRAMSDEEAIGRKFGGKALPTKAQAQTAAPQTMQEQVAVAPQVAMEQEAAPVAEVAQEVQDQVAATPEVQEAPAPQITEQEARSEANKVAATVFEQLSSDPNVNPQEAVARAQEAADRHFEGLMSGEISPPALPTKEGAVKPSEAGAAKVERAPAPARKLTKREARKQKLAETIDNIESEDDKIDAFIAADRGKSTKELAKIAASEKGLTGNRITKKMLADVRDSYRDKYEKWENERQGIEPTDAEIQDMQREAAEKEFRKVKKELRPEAVEKFDSYLEAGMDSGIAPAAKRSGLTMGQARDYLKKKGRWEEYKKSPLFAQEQLMDNGPVSDSDISGTQQAAMESLEEMDEEIKFSKKTEMTGQRIKKAFEEHYGKVEVTDDPIELEDNRYWYNWYAVNKDQVIDEFRNLVNESGQPIQDKVREWARGYKLISHLALHGTIDANLVNSGKIDVTRGKGNMGDGFYMGTDESQAEARLVGADEFTGGYMLQLVIRYRNEFNFNDKLNPQEAQKIINDFTAFRKSKGIGLNQDRIDNFNSLLRSGALRTKGKLYQALGEVTDGRGLNFTNEHGKTYRDTTSKGGERVGEEFVNFFLRSKYNVDLLIRGDDIGTPNFEIVAQNPDNVKTVFAPEFSEGDQFLLSKKNLPPGEKHQKGKEVQDGRGARQNQEADGGGVSDTARDRGAGSGRLEEEGRGSIGEPESGRDRSEGTEKVRELSGAEEVEGDLGQGEVRSREPGYGGVSSRQVNELKQVIQNLAPNWKGGPVGGIDVSLSTDRFLPIKNAVAKAKKEGKVIEAVYMEKSDRIIILADMLQPKKGETREQAAGRVLLEEAFGHKGLRDSMRGKDGKVDPALDRLLRDLHISKRKQINAAGIFETYGWNPKNQEDQIKAAEEWFAHFYNPETDGKGWLKRFADIIRKFSKQVLGVNMGLTNAEIREMARKSREAIVEGKIGGGLETATETSDIKMSKKPIGSPVQENLFEGMGSTQKNLFTQDELTAKPTGKQSLPVEEKSAGVKPLPGQKDLFTGEEVKAEEKSAKKEEEDKPEQGMLFAKKKADPAIVSSIPEVQAAFERTSKPDEHTFGQKAKMTMADIHGTFKKHFPKLNYKKHGDIANALRIMEHQADYSKIRAGEEIAKVLKGLDENQYRTLTAILVQEDLLKEVGPGGNIDVDKTSTLPLDYKSEAQIQSDLKDNMDKFKSDPALKKAYEMHHDLFDNLAKQMVEMDLMDEDAVKDNRYFHHQVVIYRQADLARQRKTAGGTKGARTTTAPWQIARQGSVKDYYTDYLYSYYDVLAGSLRQIEAKKVLNKIEKYNERDKFEEMADKWNRENMSKALMPAAYRGKGRVDVGEKVRPIDPKMGEEGKPWLNIGTVTDIDEANDTVSVHFYNRKTGRHADKDFSIKELMIPDKANFKTWQDMMPSDGSYSLWYDQPEGIRYQTMSISDQFAEAVMLGATVNPGQMNPVTALLPSEALVLPTDIVETLKGLEVQKQPNVIAQAFKVPQNLWKEHILLNPLRAIKYNINNMSGDLDIVLAANPGILKYVPKAVNHLWKANWYRDINIENLNDEARKSFMVARQQAVIGGGQVAQEFGDLKNFKDFKKLVGGAEPSPARKIATAPATVPMSVVSGYYDFARKASTARENMLRLAAFYYYQDKLNQGKKLYAASDPATVDAIEDIDTKAALLSRELLGDYGNLTVAGQAARAYLVPFYSWMEINAPRYYRLMRNAGYEQDAKTKARIVGVVSKNVALKAIKIAGLYALLNMWNNFMWPDEEEDLGLEGMKQMHIIAGIPGLISPRDEDGNVRVLRLQGALSDVLGWVGQESIVNTIKAWRNGETTLGEELSKAPKEFANKWAQGVGPYYKMPTELAMGMSFFPDVFNPRPIRDRAEHASKVVSGDLFVKWYQGKPEKTSKLNQLLQQMLFYHADVGQNAYFDTRNLVRAYQDSKNKGSGKTIIPDDKSNNIYWLKQALRYDDEEAAIQYRDYLLKNYYDGDMDKLKEGLEKSIDRDDPSAALAEEDGQEFWDSLSERQKRQVRLGTQWYKDVYLSNTDETFRYESSSYRRPEKSRTKGGRYYGQINSRIKAADKAIAAIENNDLVYMNGRQPWADKKTAKSHQEELKELGIETKVIPVKDRDTGKVVVGYALERTSPVFTDEERDQKTKPWREMQQKYKNDFIDAKEEGFADEEILYGKNRSYKEAFKSEQSARDYMYRLQYDMPEHKFEVVRVYEKDGYSRDGYMIKDVTE